MTIAAHTRDPYNVAAYPLLHRVRRAVWNIAYLFLFRISPRPFHAWRSSVLRIFGATLGPSCHIYPSAKIWAPWNLVCEDSVAIADEAIIYNHKPVTLKSHAIVSQQAYVCGATHDYNDPAFPLVAYEMTIGSYAWICVRAVVSPGVNVGDGAVLGLGAIATRDLESWTVYAGVPAKPIKKRRKHDNQE
jgi:putative colanic acid biosynthesis acetyltransferase WcaF